VCVAGVTLLRWSGVVSTCELFLAAVSHAGLQVLQLDLNLLVVPHGLFALPPDEDDNDEDDI